MLEFSCIPQVSIVIPAAYHSAYSTKAAIYNPKQPAHLQIGFALLPNSSFLLSDILSTFNTNPVDMHAAWIFSWIGAFTLLYALPPSLRPVLANLDAPAFNITSNNAVDWSKIPSPLQKSATPVMNPVDQTLPPYTTYIPLEGNVYMLFIRTDVLKSLGFNHPPATWSELLHMATLAHASDITSGPGRPLTKYGICLEMDAGKCPNCFATIWVDDLHTISFKNTGLPQMHTQH